MTDDRVNAMARAYVEQGLSYSQIAEEYGLSRQRVGQLLGPLGLAQERGPREKVAREQKLRAAHARIEAGETTLKQEADALGYASTESMRSVLYNLDLRITDKRPEPPHGTISRYRRRVDPCRCEECRRANREYVASLKHRGGEPPSHGYSGYVNYGCRCQICTTANRVQCRAQRAARRREKEVNA